MPGPAFAALAAAIDRRLPTDTAAQLLADYRAEIRREAAMEQRAEASSICHLEPREANGMFRAADLLDPKNACPIP
jgi:hypothetical protein